MKDELFNCLGLKVKRAFECPVERLQKVAASTVANEAEFRERPYRTGRPLPGSLPPTKVRRSITIRDGPWDMRKDMRQQLKRAMLRCEELEENVYE
jgi:hypothetical protein